MKLQSQIAFCLLFSSGTLFADDDFPRSLDTEIKIELFAESPQIVTPTGIDVDHTGRVWAIESNTHFPPEGYSGHPTDRILVMQDTNGDGKADKIVTFTDGLTHTMSIAVKPLWLDIRGQKSEISDQKKNVESNPKSTIRNLQSVFIATRRDIFLFHDENGDLKADRKERIIRLQTEGDYPHDGLAGFAFDAMGWMYFGFGENLGADYKLIGSDGTTLSGGGEGGNIYRCRPDGTKLKQWATGFWNPHASCVDAFGRLFTVDNDPDSRPPCRLLHIIEGGDYGYRFRNGRKGLHPFTSWNGEIPGTLPMVSGTGEAPSGIVAYESDGLPKKYIGNLLVTSWGDHRIDRFVLEPRGASFQSRPETIIQGGENFRPVGLAVAPDGSLFCTDWVLKDYKLHGRGRIWRISMKQEPVREVIDVVTITPELSLEQLEKYWKSPRLEVRRQAAQAIAASHRKAGTCWLDIFDWPLRVPDEERRQQKEWAIAWWVPKIEQKLGDSDANVKKLPFVARHFRNSMPRADDPFNFAFRLSALWVDKAPLETLVREFRNARPLKNLDVPSEKQVERVRLACLLGGRRVYPKDRQLPKLALADEIVSLRRIAVQWVAEENLTELRPQVEAVLNSENMTTDLFLATLAALEMLDGKSPKDFDNTPPAKYVLPLLRDEKRSAAVRAQALRLVDADDPALDKKLFQNLLAGDDAALKLEAVRTLQQSSKKFVVGLLTSVAIDEKAPVDLRAEAVTGLYGRWFDSPNSSEITQTLTGLMNAKQHPLQLEAIRSSRSLLVKTAKGRAARTALLKSLKSAWDQDPQVLKRDGIHRQIAEQLALALSQSGIPLPEIVKPVQADRPKTNADWYKQVVNAKGNVSAGRRIFFHADSAGCYKCHTVNGRGENVGPDLSTIGRALNRKRLIESILEPSKEIAPQFTNWTFVMKSGKIHHGMILGDIRDDVQRVGTPEGQVIKLKAREIELRQPQKTSVMPEKLIDRMTVSEFRDLLAYLQSLK